MGAPKRVWSTLWEAAAQIDTFNGREYFTGTREEAADYVRVRMRYHPRAVNITAQCRATDTRRGIVYAVSAVLFDDKRTLLTLTCVSGVSDG
jgi:head-tail adaptor